LTAAANASICSALGHIDLARQHRHPGGGLHLGGGFVQRVLLHVDQHQVHAEPGANARALQPEAGARAGENCRFALEIRDHASAFLRM
jgi:hypothetical protein